MTREWISANRLSREYDEGVEFFIKRAVEHAKRSTELVCPCIRCVCFRRVSADTMRDHLYVNGFDPSYTCWIFHGETKERLDENNKSSEPFENCYGGDSLEEGDLSEEVDSSKEGNMPEEMTRKVEENVRDCPKMFEKLLSDSETPLFGGCKKFSKLSGVLRLYNLKTCNRWSDKSFTELLTLLKEMLPDDNVLPDHTYEAKKILATNGIILQKGIEGRSMK